MKRRDPNKRPPKPAPEWLPQWQQTAEEWRESTYRFCYVVGVRTARCWRSIVRFTRVFWRPLANGMYRVFDFLVLRTCRRLKTEWQSLREDFALVGEHVRVTTADRTKRLLALPLKAIRRHRAVFRTLLNVGAPLAALLILVNTFTYWQQSEFMLALRYDGKTVGYIANKTVYANAAATVQGLVTDEDNTFKIEPTPQLTVAVNQTQPLLDEQALCEVIFEQVGDAVTRTSGLYVDGVFRGALDRASLEKLMAAVLAANEDPKADHVDFFPRVEVIDGVYPSSSVREAASLQQYLNTLPIKSVRYETKTEKLAYVTVVEETTEQPLGYQVIKKRGKNGRHKVTEEIITVNGKEQYRSVVSSEVLQAPVNQVVIVGAQKYSEEAVAGDGKATGNFIWPLPYTKVISSPFASRWGSFHGAIDISNGSTNGKPIIASDGGTVIEAEYHGSYGHYVLIDHGNGYMTRYAHCSKLMVEEGQKVAQGEYIANVGNTGYSFGAHLHFEIIKNGQLVDPLDYVKR